MVCSPDKKYWFGLYKKDRAPGDTEPGVTSYWLDENPSKFRKWDDDDYRDYEDDDDESDNSGHCVRYTRAGFKDKPCSRSYYFTCKVNAGQLQHTELEYKLLLFIISKLCFSALLRSLDPLQSLGVRARMLFLSFGT